MLEIADSGGIIIGTAQTEGSVLMWLKFIWTRQTILTFKLGTLRFIKLWFLEISNFVGVSKFESENHEEIWDATQTKKPSSHSSDRADAGTGDARGAIAPPDFDRNRNITICFKRHWTTICPLEFPTFARTWGWVFERVSQVCYQDIKYIKMMMQISR